MKKTAFERFMEWKQSKPKNDIQLQARIDEIEYEFKKMRKAASLKEKKIIALRERIHLIENRVEFALTSPVLKNQKYIETKIVKRMLEKSIENE